MLKEIEMSYKKFINLILIPIILFTGALAGAVGMAAPTYLKTRFGADEVVTTLLLNFIIKIASGKIKPKARNLNQDDFIPWKRGMSL